MTEDARLTGDVGSDDLALHRSISARERVEAVLKSEHMSPQQAADALIAQLVESPGSYPHIVVTSVDPRAAARFDEAEKLIAVREHIGPFPDRRSAERWALAHYADKPGVAWTTAQVRRPAWVEEDVRRLRSAVRPPAD